MLDKSFNYCMRLIIHPIHSLRMGDPTNILHSVKRFEGLYMHDRHNSQEKISEEKYVTLTKQEFRKKEEKKRHGFCLLVFWSIRSIDFVV